MLPSPRTRTVVSGFYFIVFLTLGATTPYFPLWLRSLDIKEHQIGIIAASPSLVMILTTLYIGGIADRARDWRTAIIACNLVGAIWVSCLVMSSGFYSVLTLWTLFGIALLAMTPILDAATVRLSRRQQLPFHRIRAFGSAGFILGVLLGGRVIDLFGPAAFLYLLITLSWCQLFASLALPRFRAGPTDQEPSLNRENTDVGSLLTPWFLLVLIGSALIQGSHGFYYGFSTLLWTESGYSASQVSALWMTGVVAEIIVMWLFEPIARRYSARVLMLIAAVLAASRWLVFGVNPGYTVLMLTQILHGVVFALLLLATVNFIANWTPVAAAARAQTLAATLSTASVALATLASGYLVTSIDVRGYWVMAALSALALLLIGISMRLNAIRT